MAILTIMTTLMLTVTGIRTIMIMHMDIIITITITITITIMGMTITTTTANNRRGYRWKPPCSIAMIARQLATGAGSKGAVLSR